ncbi:MAG: hypothetical protein J7J93_00115 [Candidatus Aenigmarchaeota archaeon]|nr:hypothetical protein [Candidatus Aenigmarchaeota archaeon]
MTKINYQQKHDQLRNLIISKPYFFLGRDADTFEIYMSEKELKLYNNGINGALDALIIWYNREREIKIADIVEVKITQNITSSKKSILRKLAIYNFLVPTKYKEIKKENTRPIGAFLDTKKEKLKIKELIYDKSLFWDIVGKIKIKRRDKELFKKIWDLKDKNTYWKDIFSCDMSLKNI